MVDRADPLTPGPGRSGPGLLTIGLVAVGQLLALAWLLAVPLPSIEAQRLDALASGGGADALPSVRRVYFLLAADDHLSRARANLSDGEHLAQRLPIVLAALLIGGAACALGDLAVRLSGLAGRLPPLSRWPLAFAAGATLLAALALAVGRLGMLAPWPTRLGLGVLVALGVGLRLRDWRRPAALAPLAPPAGRGAGGVGGPSRTAGPCPSPDPSPQPSPRWRGEGAGASRGRAVSPAPASGIRHPASGILPPWPALGLAAVLAPVLALMALGAMQPTIEYDALEYHLQGPKEYYQAGRIAFLPHNVYASMPSAVEMLHLLGMTVLDDWWPGALAGQLLVAAFAPATAALVASAAWRWGSPRAAGVAALVYLTTPWVFRLATFPFVEGPLCSYHAGLVVVAGVAWSRPDGGRRSAGPWGLAGLLAGGAMASKYPGLVSAVVPFGAVALAATIRGRSWMIPAAFAAGMAVGVGPWLARNVADTGNPVYPLAFGLFGGADWDATLDARWSAAHGPKPATAAALGSSAVDVAGRSDWQSPLYALLAPLALLRAGSRRPAAWLLAYVAYLFATWFLLTHRLDRFWLPLLPAAAVLAGLGADWTRRRPWPAWLASVVGVATATNLLFLTTPLCGPTDWLGDLPRLRREAAEAANAPLARLDAALPRDALPLLVGQAAVFPVGRPVLYNTVFDRERIAAIVAGRSPAEVADELARQGITHVYVDWAEVARHTRPGGYGFDPIVSRTLFDRLVSAGVLGPPTAVGPDHLLYPVRPQPRTAPEDDRSP